MSGKSSMLYSLPQGNKQDVILKTLIPFLLFHFIISIRSDVFCKARLEAYSTPFERKVLFIMPLLQVILGFIDCNVMFRHAYPSLVVMLSPVFFILYHRIVNFA